MSLLTNWKGTQDRILAMCAGKLEVFFNATASHDCTDHSIVEDKEYHWLFQSNTLIVDLQINLSQKLKAGVNSP
jgi:hypothetical protein